MHKYSEEITDYLFNQMSDLQRESFEHRLADDMELTAEVARQKQMISTIDSILKINEAREDPHFDEAEKLATEFLEAQDKQFREMHVVSQDSQESDTDNLDEQKVRRVPWRRVLDVAAAIAIYFMVKNLPFETKAMRRWRYKARAAMGMPKGMSRKFGSNLGRYFAKVNSWFRKR